MRELLLHRLLGGPRRGADTHEPPCVVNARGLGCHRLRNGGRAGQPMLTPKWLRAAVTGWKKVVPPEEQLPLPPEVRP